MIDEKIKNISNSMNGPIKKGQKVMKLIFLVHLYVYIAVNLLLLGINFVGWQGFAWFPLPLIGWGIGIALHYALYKFSISRKVKIMDAIFILHFITYALVNLLLIYVNISNLWENFNFWFLLPLFGWGIGIIIHLTVNQLSKSKGKTVSEMSFILHLVAYGIVNFFLLYINISMFWLSQYLWFLYPLVLWGIGIIFHAITAKIIINRKLSGIGLTRLVNKMLLITNIAYYSCVNLALLFLGILVIPQVYTGTLFMWPILIALHAIYIGLFHYFERIVVSFKAVIFHATIYAASYIAAFIRPPVLNSFTINWMIFGALIWAIAIAIHLVLAIIWERSEHNLKVLNRSVFLVHLFAYVITMITLIILNLTTFTGPLWSIVAAFGWLVGLGEHYVLYLCYEKEKLQKINARGILKISTYIHITAYVLVGILLIWINLNLGGFLWFIIAMVGWGIGLGPHLIINNLVNKK